jgi:5-methylcytosine-specific restriction endonuclease McrA
MKKMDTVKLLNDIKRMRNSSSFSNKRRNTTKGDFIKKKFRYTCAYCQGSFPEKKLRTSVESFHIVKHRDTLESILEFYKISKKEYILLNPHLSPDEVKKGDFIKMDTDFKIFPNTHGICYCEKCGKDKREKRMHHIDYLLYLLENRRSVRDQVTPLVRSSVLKRDNHSCFYCEKEYGHQPINLTLTMDHKKAVVSGGTSDPENLITSCLYHNQDKGKMSYCDYLKLLKERKFIRENTSIIAE